MNRKYIFAAVASVVLAGAVFAFSRSDLNTAVISVARPLPTAVERSTTPTPVREFTMLFAGDIMLDRNVAKNINEKGGGDYRFPFMYVRDALRKADLAFANLEGPVSSGGVKTGSIYSFRFDPKSAPALADAGFDVVSLANNHVWDYGRQALTDTFLHLTAASVSYAGAGKDDAQAHRPVIKKLADGTRVAFLAYTEFLQSGAAGPGKPGITRFDRERIAADIKKVRQDADIVVASYHMGDEYQTRHNLKQEEVFKEAIDAGADLVIGHHPHVTQEVEQYTPSFAEASEGHSGWIAYSLGNFVFDQYFSAETMSSFILKATVREGKVVSVQELPVQLTPEFQPKLKAAN